jgi:AraC-like DNA-binding protein
MNICSLAARIEEKIKEIDFGELENAVGYSYHHIRTFFKHTAGISLSRYILARKIANAAFEIRHSKKNITEIANEYGFSSDTFAQAFRRGTGMTPSQFKKADYLCGRRIICAGVYAPVILNIDNPAFTLKHLKEVNEMGEMKKTSDSCVLYGVPKIFYGREVDGMKQATPFPMCLQSVLNYMGQNISYAELMAYSGAAFRQRWDSGGWNVAAVDIRFTYERHLEPFERAFKGAGRKFVISESPAKAIKKDDAIALIKSELDCGRPVIALGVVGPPEACIVTGYRNNGETLLGWSLFQDFWGNCEKDESGYFIKNNWWNETEAIMSIGEEISKCTTEREVLENALMLMTTKKMPTYGGNDIFYGGQAAYEAWAKALEDESLPDDVKDCHTDAEIMLGEGRSYAASYMCILAEKHPALSAEFKKCAKHLSAAAECVTKMREENGDFYEMQTRKKIAALVRLAAKHESDACAALTEIIEKM